MALRLHGAVWLWVVLLSAVWVGGARAYPRVREASDTIADSATRRIVETIPETGMDLPALLPRPEDVYLLVTAGAAYTDVRVLGQPGVTPSRLARALADAEAGTLLADTDATWSADTFSAARLVQKRGRLGRRAAENSVPLTALADGLRRAGFVPHLLLRVPAYATGAGLPPAPYSTRRFRWYDSRSLGARPIVTVRAGLATSPLSLWPFALPLLIPLVGMSGLAVGGRLARDQRQPVETRRRRFRAWAHQTPLLGILLVVPMLVFGLRSSALDVTADLWLGSSSAALFMTLLILLVPAAIVPLLVIAHRRELRLLGKPAVTAATWLTEEEKALNRRMARWKSLTHVLGAVVLGGVIIFVPHKGPLSSAWHSFYQVFIALGAGLVSLLFRKQVAALTRRTQDDDLTFRARRFGQLLGARPREVWVEDSSRAGHFAVAHRDRGDHIVVSRKMRDGFTEAEMDFVLAAQVARMGRRPGVKSRLWLLLPALLIIGLPIAVIFTPGSSFGSLLLSPWFLPALIGAIILPFVLLLMSSRAIARDTLRQEEEADKKALEVTGDLAAAQSALAKTDADTLPPVTGVITSSSATAAQGAGRLEVRRQALRRVGGASFG